MTDITDEQRAAWQRLSNSPDAPGKPGAKVEDDAAVLVPLLPPELTNPHPVLPTKPGWYQGFDKVAQSQVTIRLGENGNWGHGITGSAILANPERFAPFTRLVPDRPQITRERLVWQLENHMSGSWNPESIANICVAWVNGADRD